MESCGAGRMETVLCASSRVLCGYLRRKMDSGEISLWWCSQPATPDSGLAAIVTWPCTTGRNLGATKKRMAFVTYASELWQKIICSGCGLALMEEEFSASRRIIRSFHTIFHGPRADQHPSARCR